MHNTHLRELQFYQTPSGREPFTEWFESIRDQRTQDRIQTRLDAMALGNLGDRKSVGAGVYELRFHFGAGYRVYYGEIGNTIVLLLCGGDKSTQRQDIKQAKAYWAKYKEIQQ
ncbi:MAG: type II toxin-antitoxin system RelE/ParE family toxin [Candidatus Poribacteria bacterium]|nr:type II toxin-antitoxin system RelE/ParE family toxin [Candidatus Poribacteria bacterium]